MAKSSKPPSSANATSGVATTTDATVWRNVSLSHDVSCAFRAVDIGAAVLGATNADDV